MKIIKNKSKIIQNNIEDISIVTSGIPAPKIFESKNNSNLPFFRISNIGNKNKLYLEDTKDFLNIEQYKKNIATKGSVVIAKSGESINKKRKVKLMQDSVVVGHLAILKSKIDENYFYFLLKSSNLEDDLIKKSTMPSISLYDIKKYKISYHEEKQQQEKIAQVLSMQEEQIERIKGLIKKLEKRNQYYAEKLLSGELRIKENTETGQIEFYENEEWQEVVLNGEQCKIPTGWNIGLLGDENSEILLSGVRSFDGLKKYYATGDIKGRCGFNDTYKTTNFESKDSRANMEPQIDTVWFAKMKDTEKQLIFTKDCNFEKINKIILSTGFCGIKVCKNLDVNYLFEFLCSKKFNDLKNNLSMGSTQKSINNGNIKKISYTYPNISDQINIARVLKSLNEELDKIKQLLPKEEKRFQWMLDNLLSGEYEIVD